VKHPSGLIALAVLAAALLMASCQVDCPVCEGSGICLTCEGTGDLRKTLNPAPGTTASPCTNCGATGVCQTCNGTGRYSNI
jgi:DnaJ-class molecular chaperone